MGLIDFVISAGGGYAQGTNMVLGEDNNLGLPPMLMVGQGTLVNGYDFLLGTVGKSAATIVGGPVGWLAGVGADFVTTGASLFYDTASANGDIETIFTLGVSPEGVYLIFWP
ncbi:MAG: hypothetical protein ABFS17_04155 [Chloroflexota bacterium]